MKVSDRFRQYLADDATFYSLLIVLVAVTSFGLGKWSADEMAVGDQSAAVVTPEREPSEVVAADSDTTTAVETAEAVQLVASKNGSKYHFLWCPGAAQMNEENKIYFDSKAAAEAAGYEPAANCKGL